MNVNVKHYFKIIEILEKEIKTKQKYAQKDILELYNDLLLREYCLLEKNIERIFPNEM